MGASTTVLTCEELIQITPDAHKVSALSDLWTSRYLLWILVWRDVKVRYKQTVLGAAWAMLQPLLTMVVFTLVFDRVAHISSGAVPYPLFVLCGLLPWQFFSSGLVRASNSLVESRYLLTKVPIPRLLLPVSAVLSGAPDFGVALTLLLGVMMYYGIWPSLHGFFILPLVFAVALASLSIGLFLAALHVRYRDIGYVIPFFAQLMFFVTPVAYPISLVPQRWAFLYKVNPMTSVVEACRYAIIGREEAGWLAILASTALLGTLLIASFWYFRRMEGTFADVV